MRSGVAYLLPPLALPTGETVSGSWPTPEILGERVTRHRAGEVWPTPNTLDGTAPRDPATVTEWNNARDGRTGRKTLANLRQAVHDPNYQEKFPTPRAEDSEQTGAHRGVPDTLTSYTRLRPTGESFPTPTVYDATGHGAPRSEQKEGSRHAVSLHHLAADWPTPTSGMHKQDVDDSGRYAEYVRDGGFQVTLAAAVKLRDADGKERPWPTPMAGSNRTSRKAQVDRPTSGPSRGGASFGLEDAVEMAEREMWPTPRANERQQRNSSDNYVALSLAVHDRETFPTPTASDAVGGPGQGENSEGSPNLRTVAREWATPTAATNRKSRRAMTASKENGRRSGGGQSSPPALEQMVELASGVIPKELEGMDPGDLPPATRALWPTPRARDWKGTDHSREANESGARHAGDDLATAVDKRNWPTPMAGPVDVRAGGGHGGVQLASAVTVEEEGPDAPRGQLNPDWVEWLMGWPVGWTSLEPLAIGAKWEWEYHMDHLSWWNREPGDIPRISVGIPSRVSRLKAVGNGQVSLCAAAAADALYEMLLAVEEAFDLAEEGPQEITLEDLLGG